MPDGFLFENGMSGSAPNSLLDALVQNGIIDSNNKLIIEQDTTGIDLQDRIAVIIPILQGL